MKYTLRLAALCLTAALLLTAVACKGGETPSATTTTAGGNVVQTLTPTTTTTAVPTTTTTTVPPIPDDGSDGYLSHDLYIWNNAAWELFYGGSWYADGYAQTIASFKQYLPEQTVYNMIVPNHSEFGLPERLRDKMGCSSQREITSLVYDSYSEDIVPVDIYDVMALHKNEYLYYNTDTHWASLGAYYAYTKFCEVAGVPALDIAQMEMTTVEDFCGYLYYVTEEPCLDENPDHIDLYEPPVDYTAYIAADSVNFVEVGGVNSPWESAGYSMFAWGDQPCMKIINHEGQSGRKVLIVKDSYGNAMVPFLVSSFDETHVADLRHFSQNLAQYCTDNGITDVLFFNNVMSMWQTDNLNALFD